jgi:hypothetical protein
MEGHKPVEMNLLCVFVRNVARPHVLVAVHSVNVTGQTALPSGCVTRNVRKEIRVHPFYRSQIAPRANSCIFCL